MNDKEKMLLGPVNESGSRDVVWKHGEEVVHGTLEDVKEGAPIEEGARFVEVSTRPDVDGWHDTRTLYVHSGPSQVATHAYRAGYDRIFGKKEVGLA